MITVEDMVQREVLCCMSSLVSTLAKGGAHASRTTSAVDCLMLQALELAAPVLDYEEAARQAGGKKQIVGIYKGEWWKSSPGLSRSAFKSAQELCGHFEIDPYEWEVYEHWAISQWLAEKLQAQGERVDTDFAGLNVWARTTTGQAIGMDGCIQRIYADMMAPHTLDSVAPGA